MISTCPTVADVTTRNAIRPKLDVRSYRYFRKRTEQNVNHRNSKLMHSHIQTQTTHLERPTRGVVGYTTVSQG